MFWNRWTDFALHMGALAHVAYLADPSKAYLSVWSALALFILPYVVVLMVRFGELNPHVVLNLHLLAAIWFVGLTSLCGWFAIAGYRPDGWRLFFGFMAPGLFLCGRAVPRLLWIRRGLEKPF
jgi:hypothetical protein